MLCLKYTLFCDASTAGYGACCYLRAINQNGCVRVTLVASKGQLAPIQQITIPQLEFSAEVTAVKLDRLVRSELNIDLTESYFWTDSEIVIAYLRNDSKRYKTFVANRVSQICELTETNQWRHISGRQNPADVLS